MKSVVKIICLVFVLTTALSPRVSAQNTDDDDDDSAKDCKHAAGRVQTRCGGDTESLGNAVNIPDDWDSLELRLRLKYLGADLSYLRDASGYLSRVAQSGELDFKAIAKSASEITRRAARLKDRLALPAMRKSAERGEEKVISDSGELKAALSALSALLSGAVRDPVLTGHMLDAAKTFETSSRLDAIVELSDRVKASSGSLAKTIR